MTRDRYIFLEKHYEEKLTSEEVAEGWHWCDDWDFMLVGPGMEELAYCSCGLSEHGTHAQQQAKKKLSEDLGVQESGLDDFIMP